MAARESQWLTTTEMVGKIVAVVDMQGIGYLWHNEHDGTFSDQTAAAQILFSSGKAERALADIDNDGYRDLLLMVAEGQMMLCITKAMEHLQILLRHGWQTPADQNSWSPQPGATMTTMATSTSASHLTSIAMN